MSNCVAELDALLQSMQELKPPGVSGPKINQITTLCTSNIKEETVLIQKVYAHFKKAPSNKKLGVLYVVDSVSRQWLDQARKSGQTVVAGAADGTFAAGVNHVTELLPSFMSDIITAAPEEQKVKIKKLVDIWERGTTFPATMLAGFRTKLEAAPQSTTPPGTPPVQLGGISHNAQLAAPAAAAPDTASILANLQALANLPKTTATPPAGNLAQGSSASNLSYPQPSFTQNPASVNAAAYPMPAAAPAVNAPAPINGGVLSYGGGASLLQNMFPNGQNNSALLQSMMPQQQQQSGQADSVLQQQLQILAVLKAQGIPEQQWPALLQVLVPSQNANGGNVAAAAAAAIPQQYGQSNAYGAPQNGASRDSSGGYDQYIRSPPSRNHRDSRSRSPVRDRNRNRSPSGRRGSPTYGEYSGGDDHGRGGRGRSGRGNRQRSPDRYRRSPSPQRQEQQDFGPPAEKFMEFDNSIPDGSIKVLSRTLFVGGVTCSENELRQVFSKFGRVQTCIVNTDKRHAFVKMVSRTESEAAKIGMEHYKSDSMQLRTRWGVGFGPRPCCDYATGVSTIPIDNLTEADRKWMLTAEYGGTGGKPIQPRMVVEEPDIEIGAGVSSKAISRRMQTDKSGQMGPRSTRENPGRQRGGRENDNPNQTPLGNANQRAGAPPSVPGFGMPFMQSGMPMFPGNFPMPGQNGAHPGAPGTG